MYSCRVQCADPASPPPFVRLAGHPLRWRLVCELARSDRRARELVVSLGRPQNLVSYHLGRLRDAGLVTARRSSFDGRDAYYHLDLARCAQALAATGAALHPALQAHTALQAGTPPQAGTLLQADAALPAGPPPPPARCSVLFLCTGNSARSPMAEALLRRRAGSRIDVASAGSHPRPVHPDTVRVMRDGYGIDLAGRQPRKLGEFTGRRLDYVISLCDKVREVCPPFSGHPELVHWSIADPAAAARSAAARRLEFSHTAAELDTRIRFLLPVLDQAA